MEGVVTNKNKILIYEGDGHIAKKGDEKWTPMAEYLEKLTGRKILSIDQTSWTEKFSKKYGPPYFRRIEELYKSPRKATIFMQNKLPYVPNKAKDSYDILIYHPRVFN